VDESPRLAFYYVIGQILCHVLYTFTVFIPIFHIVQGVLWDYIVMLMINVCLIGSTAYCLYQCHTTNPGRLDESYGNIVVWRRLYEQTLDALASADETLAQQAVAVQLCHSCHIARPPRSKHDRFSRCCILQFDHHCPFVGTTVGLYNYKWFFAFIVSMTIYFINFFILLYVQYQRTASSSSSTTTTHGDSTNSSSWYPLLVLLLGVYLGLHILFSGGMVFYHAQLVYANLTTNEHLNLTRYDYLWKTTTSSSSTTTTTTTGSVSSILPTVPRRTFDNPWDRGCWHNMYHRFVEPGDGSYLIPTSTAIEHALPPPPPSLLSPRGSMELYQPLVGRRMVETV
jgi:hypothetical protein